MGVVVAAYDERLNRRFAIKLVAARSAEHHAELESRLLSEAQALARLNHPHVVPVYDAAHEAGLIHRHA